MELDAKLKKMVLQCTERKKGQIPTKAFTDTRIKKGRVIEHDGVIIDLLCTLLEGRIKIVNTKKIICMTGMKIT